MCHWAIDHILHTLIWQVKSNSSTSLHPSRLIKCNSSYQKCCFETINIHPSSALYMHVIAGLCVLIHGQNHPKLTSPSEIIRRWCSRPSSTSYWGIPSRKLTIYPSRKLMMALNIIFLLTDIKNSPYPGTYRYGKFLISTTRSCFPCPAWPTNCWRFNGQYTCCSLHFYAHILAKHSNLWTRT